VQQIETKTAAAEEIVLYLRTQRECGHRTVSDINVKNLVGISMPEFHFAVVHFNPFVAGFL
jgi:hypothetical protein